MEYLGEMFCILTVIGVLFYKWLTNKHKCLSKRNIAHEKPVFLIGNVLSVLNGKEHLSEMLIRLHKKFREEKIYGFFGWINSIIFIRDPELIKKVAIKDFDCFTNHETKDAQAIINDETIANMLTLLKDEKWKDMRTTLTPVFTGNKMRQVFHIISECSYEAIKYLRQTTKLNEGTEINLADFFHNYSNDVIASAAFGLKINSYDNKESEFSKMGAALLRPQGLWVVVKSIFITLSIMICPKIGKIFKILKINITDSKALNYLKGVVSQTIRQRQEHKIIRQDMIHLMLESQNHQEDSSENSNKWKENEMVAQCILFLFAGLGPMSNMLCSTVYELMKNPEIQEKLYEEVAKINEELDGAEISYELLKNMKYLDMVVSESLRKWPSVPILDRVCSKLYALEDVDGKLVANLKPGDVISFSIYGSHFDEENFENPYVFDPERFSDENKSTIKPFTYFPFGLGPRSCIANRFALMVGKILMYQLVLEFKFGPSPKSTADIIAATRGIQLKLPELFWMNLYQRSK